MSWDVILKGNPRNIAKFNRKWKETDETFLYATELNRKKRSRIFWSGDGKLVENDASAIQFYTDILLAMFFTEQIYEIEFLVIFMLHRRQSSSFEYDLVQCCSPIKVPLIGLQIQTLP